MLFFSEWMAPAHIDLFILYLWKHLWLLPTEVQSLKNVHITCAVPAKGFSVLQPKLNFVTQG